MNENDQMLKTVTRVSAAWVLGSFIRSILTVKLSVAFPLLLVEAAAVGTAELVWSTGWIFCSRTGVCLEHRALIRHGRPKCFCPLRSWD